MTVLRIFIIDLGPALVKFPAEMHGWMPNTQCGALDVGQKQNRNGFQALLACHEWLLLFATEHGTQMLPTAVAHIWVF